MSHQPQPALVWRQNQAFSKDLGTIGTILEITKIHNGPKNTVVRTPYQVALVDFGNHKKMIQLCRRSEDIAIGDKIKLIARRHQVSTTGLIKYSLKGTKV